MGTAGLFWIIWFMFDSEIAFCLAGLRLFLYINQQKWSKRRLLLLFRLQSWIQLYTAPLAFSWGVGTQSGLWMCVSDKKLWQKVCTVMLLPRACFYYGSKHIQFYFLLFNIYTSTHWGAVMHISAGCQPPLHNKRRQSCFYYFYCKDLKWLKVFM